MDIKQQTMRANGLEFNYLTVGRGPLVLCIHGFPDTPHGYTDVMLRLAAAGYRAVAPFTRGIAPSEAPADDDYSAATLGRDALAWIAALGEERAVVIGHDWGAIHAYAAVALEPARIAKLVTVAIPPLRLVRPTPAWLAMVAFFQLTPLATTALCYQDGAAVDFMYRAAAPTWHFGPEETAPFKAVLASPGGARGALGTYRSFFQQLLRGPAAARKLFQGTISVPSLNVVGSRDPTLPRAVIARIAEGFSGPFELAVLEGTGHFPHREQPDEFARRLLAFLGPASTVARVSAHA